MSACHSFLFGPACCQVFIWQTRGAFNRDFFQSATDWLPSSAKDKRHFESNHCLKEVMEYFLKDNPAAEVNCSLLLLWASIHWTSHNRTEHTIYGPKAVQFDHNDMQLLSDDIVAFLQAIREELKACAEKMRGNSPYSVTVRIPSSSP